ncbi:LysE family translocator [Motiliproteus sp.]|uniref:LysE family translocator n=1 Tax=Motiliproteus sp. TaxID=1898955 RepID=UPI003BAD30AB
MSLEVWLSFMAAALLLCLTPGPTTIFVMGQSLHQGNRAVLPLMLGTMSADLLVMTLSFIGVGAILAASAELFTLLKLVGALYLVYLGIKAWRSPVKPMQLEMDSPADGTDNGPGWGALFRRAFLITALNPKGILFFMAFFPLFLSPESAALPQMLILMASFELVSVFTVCCYGFGAGYLRSKARSERFQRRFNRLSGSALIGAGALTASLQR